jgi:CDP-4-dehydro-6-deoxyglucose reductase, E1
MNYPLVLNPFNSEEIETIIETIRGGQLTMGPEVSLFEKEFAIHTGSRFAVMTNSGSSANLIAAYAFLYRQHQPLLRGAEVLVPAIAWATTWSPLQQLGLKLKILDVNSDTLNVDVDTYLEAITPETKMIVAVSILGNPVDLARLRQICDDKKIILFEDNCESIGATVQGRQCGSFGHIGTFSFFYSHHISTIEGGMAVTDDEELYHILLSLRAHGWTREIPNNQFIGTKKLDEVRQQYNFALPGFNVRPLEISGAVGRKQLKRLNSLVEARRKNARLFTETMKSLEKYFSFQKEDVGNSSWFSFPIILRHGDMNTRNALFLHLANDGIESRMVTGGCLTLHPMIKYFDIIPYKPPAVAESIHQRGLFVANHAIEMGQQFDTLKKSLTRFIGAHGV